MIILTPVAFLIFNRPDLTQKVFEVIRKAKPKTLLVVADGPRFSEEAEKCKAARAIVEQVDWDCKLLTNYSDANLGCRRRVSSGLDWVFSQVESAIILEDDCLPHPSFFAFCDTLLSRYWNDERVWVISGDNFQDGQWRGDGSYYFSRYNHCWGWATWRRAWKYYDGDLKGWADLKASELLSSIFEDPLECQYWSQIWETLYTKNQPDTWDYQWTFTCMSNGGLTILPNINLVSNIGFRTDGTHTRNESSQANIPVADIGEIKHPSFVIRDSVADLYTFNHVFGGNAMHSKKNWLHVVKQRLSNIRDKVLYIS